MSDVLIRNVDEPVLAALKQRAAANNRSLQQELHTILEEVAARESRLERRRWALAEADRIREKIALRGQTPLNSTWVVRQDRDSDHGRLFDPYK